jgi:hypothetical protein
MYSKAQVEEILNFQASQGTRPSYLTEIAELTYGGHGKDGSWGLGMGERVRAALIDAMGWSLVPLYCLAGPFAVIILEGLLPWSLVKDFVTVIV